MLWQGIWRTSSTRKRAELFYRIYAILYRFADASGNLINMFNAFGRPVSFPIEPLLTRFDFAISIVDNLNREKNRKLRSPIATHEVEILEE